MRKNRMTSKKMSIVAKNSVRLGLVVAVLFVFAILNILATSSCNQLVKSIREKERQLVRLDEERLRENARWEQMKTPRSLELALLRHGLSMKYAKPEQTIRMRANGTPYPGQLSVSLIEQRSRVGTTAQYRRKSR